MITALRTYQMADTLDDLESDPDSREGGDDAATATIMRVLVADDDPMFAALATTTLVASKIQVETAADGAEAMTALVEGNFDLALIDLSMPKIDGFRLIALIRATPKLRNLPIAIVTSRQDAKAAEEGFQVGADDYFTKPVNWAQLPARIRQLCLRRAA
jgi:DNA-binding response OmpR family regulator